MDKIFFKIIQKINIMFKKIDEEFKYFRYQDIYFRVPTFGKIYKIIDFGRAIYEFKGKTICSDSYHPKGDAATQYNFEPYFNEKKSRLEPNFSFDLCRLGCSLFDHFFIDEDFKTLPLLSTKALTVFSPIRLLNTDCFTNIDDILVTLLVFQFPMSLLKAPVAMNRQLNILLIFVTLDTSQARYFSSFPLVSFLVCTEVFILLPLQLND